MEQEIAQGKTFGDTTAAQGVKSELDKAYVQLQQQHVVVQKNLDEAIAKNNKEAEANGWEAKKGYKRRLKKVEKNEKLSMLA